MKQFLSFLWIIIFPFYAISTPATGTITQLTFIGLIDSNYVCFENLKHIPGSHYERIDTLQIVFYSTKDNSPVKKEILNITSYKTDPMSGEKDTLVIYKNKENCIDFSELIPLRAASMLISKYQILADSTGISLYDGKDEIINLINKTELQKFLINEDYSDLQILNIYTSSNNLFLHIQYLDGVTYKQEKIITIKYNGNVW